MMDLVISPMIFAGSAALVLGIAWALKYWKDINAIPAAVSASVPFPQWWGLSGIAIGIWAAWFTEWQLSAISMTVFGLGTWLPAFMVWIRNKQAAKINAETRESMLRNNARLAGEE